MVAFSHLMAGTLFHTGKFSGRFNGVLSDYTGNYDRSFSAEEIAVATMQPK